MFNFKKLLIVFILIFSFLVTITAIGQEKDFVEMSLEELLNVEIMSVSKIAEKSSITPAVVDVITYKTIRERGYRTIYDILMDMPGFWAIQDVNDKLMGMRGVHASTSQKFLLLVNGKRITENLWNFCDIDYNISLANVKQVEIIRGPGSAVYGRAALTAVINVVTFTGEEVDGLNFELSLGNYGYKKAGFSYGTKTEKGDQIEVYGHAVKIDGQEFDVDAEEDGAENRVNGKELVDRFKFPTGGLGARFHNDKWNVNLFLQSRSYQQPRSANAGLSWQIIDDNEYYRDLYGDRLLGEEHNYIIFDAQRDFDFGDVKNSISFDYTYVYMRLRENPKPLRDVTIPDGWGDEEILEYSFGEMFEWTIESYRAGLEYFGQYNFGEKKNGLWGFEVYKTEPLTDKFASNYLYYVDENSNIIKKPIKGGYFREKPDGTFDKLRTEWLYSVYAEFKYPLMENLHLNAGARYDYHVKGEDYKQEDSADDYPDPAADEKRKDVEKTESQLSPRLALIYQPFNDEKLTVKAIYNKSFIAPGYFYRYADPSTSYSGGPWLKSETLDNYMLAFEAIHGSFKGKALYYMNINKNLLTRDNTLTPARYTSLGKLAMQGVELDVIYTRSFLDIFANYSYMVGVESETDKTGVGWIMEDETIKNFPKHYGTIGLTGRFLENQLSATALTRWNGTIQSPLNTGVGAGTVEEIDASTQTNFTLRYTPVWMNDLDFNFSLYNVFDEEIRLGGTVKRPYHQAGRWFNFSIIKNF